jgi:hypothetical protein
MDGVLKAVGSISGQERDWKAMCYKTMAGSNFQTSPPHLTNHMYVYTGISGTRGLFLSMLWCSKSGNHP